MKCLIKTIQPILLKQLEFEDRDESNEHQNFVNVGLPLFRCEEPNSLFDNE